MADSDVVQITEGLLKQLSGRLRRLEALVGGKTPRKLTKGGYDGLILVKLDAGQTLTTTASDTATGEIWTGAPGSEADTNIAVTVYSGQGNASGTTIAAGSFIFAANLGGYLQYVGPYTIASNVKLMKLDVGQTLTSTASDTATCKEWTGAPGSEAEGSAYTVYSGLLMAGGTTIAAETFIVAAYINGYWQVIASPCP